MIFFAKFFVILVLVGGIGGLGYSLRADWVDKMAAKQKEVQSLIVNENNLKEKLSEIQKEIEVLKKEETRLINSKLKEEISNIQNTFKQSLTTYEKLLDFKTLNPKIPELDKQFATILNSLSKREYSTASAKLVDLDNKIKIEKEKWLASIAEKNAANVAVDNSTPGNGYRRQLVQTEGGQFLVDLVAADLNSSKIIVDTASDGDCGNNCPVLSLGNYVARSGAYAGINGSYFCPASYPSCAGKTNSFDLLVMNKNKKYFNSDNNVYSTNPAVIFGGGWIRFVGKAQEWGRDTGVDGVISNYPLLVQDSNIVYGGSDDSKLTSKGGRSFIGNKGNTVFIGVVYNASLSDAAKVHKVLGMGNVLNLDDGGSTALWVNGGYRTGPGRDIPNAILFVRK